MGWRAAHFFETMQPHSKNSHSEGTDIAGRPRTCWAPRAISRKQEFNFHQFNRLLLRSWYNSGSAKYSTSYSVVSVALQSSSFSLFSSPSIMKKSEYSFFVYGPRGTVVSVVAFKANGRGFKSTHGCSHTVQKPSISPRLFGQCTLNICLPFTICALRNVR